MNTKIVVRVLAVATLLITTLALDIRIPNADGTYWLG